MEHVAFGSLPHEGHEFDKDMSLIGSLIGIFICYTILIHPKRDENQSYSRRHLNLRLNL